MRQENEIRGATMEPPLLDRNDASSRTESPPPKPKRAKKKRPAAAAPTPPRAKRTPSATPRRTLLARVKAMSEAHVEAFQVLGRNDPEFRDGLRAELEYAERVAKSLA